VVHDFKVQVFRYANVYGPGQNGKGEAGVVAIFAEAILSGRRPKVRGDGGQTRDYVYVADLVEAAARAAASGLSGTWNLGTGVETSVNRLFELLAGQLGYREAPESVPLPPGEQRRSVLDGSLVRRQFDLPPWTPIDQGLAATAAWFRAQQSRA
jgi:UDP-glucose 4-epimerase